MHIVNMLQAKSPLSRLVEAIEQGRECEIVIARNGRPAAKLVPMDTVPSGKRTEKAEREYTVRILCDEYLAGHIYRHRAKKGATEITRMFETMLGSLEKLPATAITRAMAFDSIQRHTAKSPVQTGKLRCELSFRT